MSQKGKIINTGLLPYSAPSRPGKLVNTNLLAGWHAPPQQLGTDLGSVRLRRAYDMGDRVEENRRINQIGIYQRADAFGEDRMQDQEQGMVIPDPQFDTPIIIPTETRLAPKTLPTDMFDEPAPKPGKIIIDTPFAEEIPMAPTYTPAGVPIDVPPEYSDMPDDGQLIYDEAPPGYDESMELPPPGYDSSSQEMMTGGALRYKGALQWRFKTIQDEHGNTLLEPVELARPEMQAGMVSGLNTLGAAQRGFSAGRQGFSRAQIMAPRSSEWTQAFPGEYVPTQCS